MRFGPTLVAVLAVSAAPCADGAGVNNPKAMRLLMECISDRQDCPDKVARSCHSAREAGLSRDLLAKVWLKLGQIHASDAENGCLCCDRGWMDPKELAWAADYAFTQALAADPRNPNVREAVFGRMIADGKGIEALGFANEGVRLVPDQHRMYELLARANLALGRWSGVREAYLEAAQLASGPTRSRYLARAAKAGIGARVPLDQLLEEFSDACAQQPQDADVHMDYGWLLSVAGRREEARRAFERGFAISPSFFNEIPESNPVRRAFESVFLGIGSEPAPKNAPPGVVTGTGFFATESGFFVTSHHVVAGAHRITVRTGEHAVAAEVVDLDVENDLALLRVLLRGHENVSALPLAPAGASLGAAAITLGFPNPELQGTKPKLTTGIVSSTAGIRDDPRHIQVSTPIQPGNSGGPIVDAYGNVIAVVQSTLAPEAALGTTGTLPQSVNYGVKSSYVTALIDKAVPHADRPRASRTARTAQEVAAVLENAIGLVVAEREGQR